MLISIIITNYNYAEYIPGCIDSCLRQCYPNLEVIVVDDGSSDGSQDIILGYGSRITPIFKENGGQASAFNAGFAASKGDIVLFVDADDVLMPHCLDRVAGLWRSALSKLHFNLLLTGKEGESLSLVYCPGPLPRGDLKPQMLDEGNHVSMPSSGNAYARDFLNRVMPMPEAGWRRSADVYLSNLSALSGQVEAIDEPLGYYRVHDKNISAHVRNSRFQIAKCRTSILREIRTDEILDEYCRQQGLKYRTGALTSSYSHLQQVLVYDKLAPLCGEARFRTPLLDYVKLSAVILKSKPSLKMTLIHLWMLLIVLTPSRYAERAVIFSYEKGAMLFARRRFRERKGLFHPVRDAIS
jgi:glycosyltransferase involved in cell wall biosynthesis